MARQTSDPAADRPLRAIEYAVLAVLIHYDPRTDERWDVPYGLGINRRLGEYYTSEINQSRTYYPLDGLVDAGYVTRDSLDERTHGYKITKQGRRELTARVSWLGTGTEQRKVKMPDEFVANCLAECTRD